MKPPEAGSPAAREGALREAGVLEPGTIHAFDRFTRLAVDLTGVEAAVVTFASGGRTWFHSAAGLPAPYGSIPDDAVNLCSHVLEHGQRLVLDDVASDPVTAAIWEVRELGLRSLAVFPLVLHGGVAVGVFALLDRRPRTWDATQLRIAEEVAATCVAEIEDRRELRIHALRRAEAAEAALVESERRFRSLVEAAPDAIFVVGSERIEYANAAAVTLTGATTTDEVVGKGIDTFLEGPHLKGVREQILGTFRIGPGAASERFHRLDGQVRDAEIARLPIVREGRPALLVFVHDVTERHRAEVALAQREGELRLLLDRLPATTWATDTDLRVTAKSGGRRGLPHPIAEPVGSLLETVFDQHDADAPPQLAHLRALAGETVGYRVTRQERQFEVRVEPLIDTSGRIIGSVAVAMDVTERVHLEEHLQEVAHIETLGRVAGGVAHEMNNVLSAILGTSSAREADPALPAPVRAEFARIGQAARRGGAIVANLLGFARGGMHRRERVPIDDLVERAAEEVRRKAPTGIRVELEVEPETPAVAGDPSQLEQALLNVCVNGLEAMGGEGRLTVHAGRQRYDEPQRVDSGELAPGIYSRIDVTDTGPGMSEDVRARAIEPFFTTKPLGHGVGLGLSMAYGVAKNHGGVLSLVSEPGRGTTVTLLLPAATQADRPPPPPATEPEPVSGHGTVLVVDDDTWVRETSRQLLEHLGYEVVEAADGVRALEAYAARREDFAFVLLDLRMPGMDGDQVLRRLVVLDPAIRVILCTGYERDQVSQALFGLGHVGFLGKPFGLDELVAQIAAFGKVPSMV